MRWVLVMWLTVSACSSETAILVEIDSTLGVPGTVDQLDLTAVGANSGGMLAVISALEGPFPYSYAIRPKDDDSEEVTITVVARKRTDPGMAVGELVTSSTVVTRFVSGEVNVVRVVLDASCAGVVCPVGETCIAGACQPVATDAGVDASMDSAIDSAVDASMDSAADSGTDSGAGDIFACAPGLTCSAGTQICCHDRGDGTGDCLPVGGACAVQALECDDSADCPGANLCCASYTGGGMVLQGAQCQASCSGSGSRTYETLCDPAAAAPCPGGLACTGTATYTALGWRTCE